jgi:hypothetical protein
VNKTFKGDEIMKSNLKHFLGFKAADSANTDTSNNRKKPNFSGIFKKDSRLKRLRSRSDNKRWAIKDAS